MIHGDQENGKETETRTWRRRLANLFIVLPCSDVISQHDEPADANGDWLPSSSTLMRPQQHADTCLPSQLRQPMDDVSLPTTGVHIGRRGDAIQHRRTCFVHVWTTGVLVHTQKNLFRPRLDDRSVGANTEEPVSSTSGRQECWCMAQAFRRHATTGVVMSRFERQEQHYQRYRSAC